MSTINGCGTKIFGDFEYFDDGSYVTIKWIVVFYIPLIPIATYRVYHAEEGKFPTLPFGTSKSTYSLRRIPMKWKYVWQFLRVIYATIGTIIGIVILITQFPQNMLVLILGLLGIFLAFIGGLLFLIHQYEK
jgi:hypothetical protein